VMLVVDLLLGFTILKLNMLNSSMTDDQVHYNIGIRMKSPWM